MFGIPLINILASITMLLGVLMFTYAPYVAKANVNKAVKVFLGLFAGMVFLFMVVVILIKHG